MYVQRTTQTADLNKELRELRALRQQFREFIHNDQESGEMRKTIRIHLSTRASLDILVNVREAAGGVEDLLATS